MAPSAVENLQTKAVFTYDHPSKLVFPDGIKTSGQFDPVYDQIKPYHDFPTKIAGATVWEAADYAKNPEQWTHYFTEQEIKEMSDAADEFIASDTPLTGIAKVCLRLKHQMEIGI